MIVSEINILDILPNTLDTREASTRLFDFLEKNYNSASTINLNLCHDHLQINFIKNV